jgi:Rieske Fe-S protein
MKRREFIRTTCTLCAALSASVPLLNSCAVPADVYKAEFVTGQLLIPINVMDQKKYLIVRNKNAAYDIFLQRTGESSYSALLMKCTHRDNPVQKTDAGFVCNEHGSRFDLQGKVLKAPAVANLHPLKVTVESNNIIIHTKSS